MTSDSAASTEHGSRNTPPRSLSHPVASGAAASRALSRTLAAIAGTAATAARTARGPYCLAANSASHSGVTLLGRSSGRPRARSHSSWDSTPKARETPKRTV